MSSGFSYPQPIFQSPIYNPAFYLTLDASGYLTYDYAQTEGAAGISQAVVLNSTKDFNGIRNLTCSGTITASTAMATPTLTCDTIFKSGTQTMNATTLNINPTNRQLRGVAITASASELNSLSGVVERTAGKRKALVLGLTGSISGINAIAAASVLTTGDITCGGA
ncbi:unnamed protein product [Phytophthora lilii]|uniref:Unnamed protein product n=1 Tax=Phytophthora lilii TaxID=2077276 RepID=A0A9W6XAH8_9STRA|nr:unnamed protein product [Phytophthora lilii]